jgi:uncharacterized protein (TIGR02001 family)
MKLDAAEPREPPAAAPRWFGTRRRAIGGLAAPERTALASALAATAWAMLPAAHAASFGGELAVTSDYIYRGLSESDGQPAVQLDLHASIASGTFVGVFTSTRHAGIAPYGTAAIDAYLGQRFVLDPSWSAALTIHSHHYVDGNQEGSNDYQEIAASLSYLDLWAFSVSAIPSEVRYANGEPAGRYAAYVAETSTQWLLAPRLFFTAGAGYYHMGSGTNTQSSTYPYGPQHLSGSGYAYGNVGLAYRYQSWRVDVGYFLTQTHAAEQLFPIPTANRRVAATLSWQF